MTMVARSPEIRTRTLRPSEAAIRPSRMLTLPTADRLHSSIGDQEFAFDLDRAMVQHKAKPEVKPDSGAPAAAA
jgi:hypothetical protein